jgi:Flp pilus assembly protein TadG
MTIARARPSHGQTLPIFALFAPVFLALMALGLDAAQVFLERRDAQGAADLAALAGARFLHDGATAAQQAQARDEAVAVAVANGYEASQVTATVPYDGSEDKIQVIIASSVNTFFMPILDLFVPGDFSTMDVSARAVAYGGYTGGGGGAFAILALETCPSLQKSVDISGSSGFFVGRVHSNSDLYISGSDMDFTGETTYVCGNSYPAFHDGGGGNTFDPAPYLGSTEPDPIALTRADFACTFTAPSTGMWDLTSNGVWWVGGTKDSKTLRAGTYCSRGTSGGIKLSDSDIVIEDIVSGPGGVTFLAQAYIEVSGSNFQLRPHAHNVLFFSEGTSDVAIKVSGSGGTWEGYIYAPNGTAEVSGQGNWNYTGGIVAKRVKLNGSDSNINAYDADAGPPVQQFALIE